MMTWIKIIKMKTETNIINILETEVRLSNRTDVGILVRWGNQRRMESLYLTGTKQSGNEAVMEEMLKWWYDE